MSWTGTPSEMQTISLIPASAASKTASAANAGGHVDDARIRSLASLPPRLRY